MADGAKVLRLKVETDNYLDVDELHLLFYRQVMTMLTTTPTPHPPSPTPHPHKNSASITETFGHDCRPPSPPLHPCPSVLGRSVFKAAGVSQGDDPVTSEPDVGLTNPIASQSNPIHYGNATWRCRRRI